MSGLWYMWCVVTKPYNGNHSYLYEKDLDSAVYFFMLLLSGGRKWCYFLFPCSMINSREKYI